MVTVSVGVVKLVPVPNELPPLDAAYQLIVPALAVAPSDTVPLPHIDAGVVAVIVGIEFMVAITAVLLAVVQPDNVASA